MSGKRKFGWFRRDSDRHEELEDKIEEEIRNEVIERSMKLQEQRRRLEEEKANLEALKEVSDLPQKEIEKISREVRSRYRNPRRVKKKKPTIQRGRGIYFAIASIIIVVLAVASISTVKVIRDSRMKNDLRIRVDARLREAVEKGLIETVKFSVKSGANVDTRDENGTPALILALQKGYKYMARYLIIKGADVNAEDLNQNSCGNTPLIEAVEKGYDDIVKLLISKGADVNAENSEGKTALSYARERGYTEITELLKQAGARE